MPPCPDRGHASSSPSSTPHSVSRDGNSGKVCKRTTRCCCGQRWPCRHLLCFLWEQETFSLMCVLQSLVSASAPSPVQNSSSFPTPPTDPSLGTGGATAPLQGHAQLSATKRNSGPNNPACWAIDVTGD